MSLYDKFLGKSQKQSQESLKRYQEALAEYQQLQQTQQNMLKQANQTATSLTQAQSQYLGQLNVAGYTTQPGAIVSYTPGLSVAPTVLKLLPEETCVQALVGWRRWSVPMFEEKLLSNNGTVWKPYKTLAAKCSAIAPAGVSCQGLSCGCGIYSYNTRKLLETRDNSPSEVTHVWGEVWLWGRVIEYTQGFRAQFAYPKAFVDTGGIARRMAVVFGVKTVPV